jgi:hypothetical protein
MSPVGSYDSLAAAIQGGANSVYFGVGKLNMRSRSSQNFNLDDLRQIATYLSKSGRKNLSDPQHHHLRQRTGRNAHNGRCCQGSWYHSHNCF